MSKFGLAFALVEFIQLRPKLIAFKERLDFVSIYEHYSRCDIFSMSFRWDRIIPRSVRV